MDETKAQHDDHIWLTVYGEGWAIAKRHGNQVLLWRGYEPNLEWLAVEMADADWEAYADAALARLEAVSSPSDAAVARSPETTFHRS
jgi:hypothetical protein